MSSCVCTICNSSSGNSSDSNKISVTLDFYALELLDDINNYAWVEGEVLGEENQHAHHTLVDIAQDGNIERVARILSLVHSAAIEILYPFTKEDVVEECVGDELWMPEHFKIRMSVPSTFSRTTIHYLSRLIHEFMVYEVLAHWLSITNPSAASKWQEKADALKEAIENAKHRRGKAFTRPLAPW